MFVPFHFILSSMANMSPKNKNTTIEVCDNDSDVEFVCIQYSDAECVLLKDVKIGNRRNNRTVVNERKRKHVQEPM